MNILMFHLLSILPHLMHGGERQSLNEAKPKKFIVSHILTGKCWRNPLGGEEPGWRLVKQSLAPAGWRCDKQEVGFTTGLLHD